jgi:hypothetical protein
MIFLFLFILRILVFFFLLRNVRYRKIFREKIIYLVGLLLDRSGYDPAKFRDLEKGRLLDYLVFRLRIAFALLVICISAKVSLRNIFLELLGAFFILFLFFILFVLILFLVTFFFYSLNWKAKFIYCTLSLGLDVFVVLCVWFIWMIFMYATGY